MKNFHIYSDFSPIPSVYNCHSGMMVYNLLMIQGFWLITFKGILLGKDVVAVLPSLPRILHTGNQQFQNIIVHPSKRKGGECSKFSARLSILCGILFKYNINPHFQCIWSSPHDGKAWQSLTWNSYGIEYKLSKWCRFLFCNVNVIFHAKQIKFFKSMVNAVFFKKKKKCAQDCPCQIVDLILIVTLFCGNCNHKLNLQIILFPDSLMNNMCSFLIFIIFYFNLVVIPNGKGGEFSAPSKGVTLSKITSSIRIMEKQQSRTNLWVTLTKMKHGGIILLIP
ncbi:uncharacterized protein VP01_2375g3 [Puccinia sorghi]|uniref:Uncharacterized protein n=1 Tax=Puccinia sorghi TaxID=27349 RepID=A0A0L6V7Q8_9BASI|nr:uncharacterized protein VP01_2375g3 [Puccinia sorghi]